MSTARIRKGITLAAQCAVSSTVGALLMQFALKKTISNDLVEVASIAAVGGMVMGCMERPQEEKYEADLTDIIKEGLHRFGMINTQNGLLGDLTNNAMTDICHHLVSITLGFMLMGGIDYATKGKNRMTLGNLFGTAALGCIPVSLSLTFALKVISFKNEVNAYFDSKPPLRSNYNKKHK